MKKEKQNPLPPVPIGKDEMNLVEFPITLLSKRHTSDRKTVKFSDTITGKDNKLVKREWIVTGSDEFGLPLAHDNDVWLAILVLGKENNFNTRKVNFSRYKLCKIMNIRKGGNKYKRIEDALNRLSGVRIYAKNAFWDNERKGYVTKNFGIIDDYELFEGSSSSSIQDSFPFSYINLNEVIYNSIQSGYIKNLDVQLYFRLKSVISKRLYRYLDKKRYGKRKFEINLFTLAYTHLGFEMDTYKYTSKIKEKLTPAHNELLKAGFLKSAEYMKTADGRSEKVVYIFEQKGKLPDGSRTSSVDNREKEKKLLEALTQVGVSEIVAQQIIKEYPIERIENQLQALQFRKAKEPAAVLVRSIQEDWTPPGAYQEHIKKEKKQKIKKQQQQKEEKEKTARREKIENYLSSLSRDELAVLTKEARELTYKHGRDFFKSFYRDKEIPHHMIKAYIHIIVEKRLGL